MMKYNVKLKTYYPSLGYFLKISCKILWFSFSDPEIVIPEWLFDRLQNVYYEEGFICDVTTLIRYDESLYEDIYVYLRCNSETEALKLKLRYDVTI